MEVADALFKFLSIDPPGRKGEHFELPQRRESPAIRRVVDVPGVNLAGRDPRKEIPGTHRTLTAERKAKNASARGR